MEPEDSASKSTREYLALNESLKDENFDALLQSMVSTTIEFFDGLKVAIFS